MGRPDQVQLIFNRRVNRRTHPFEAGDREQGIRYDISVLQAEFARITVSVRSARPSL